MNENTSDLSSSDSDDDGDNLSGTSNLMLQGSCFLNKKAFIAHSYGPDKIDFRKVWLLDSESDVDVVCNEKYVQNITKSKDTMTIHSNSGPMTARHVAHVPGYQNKVWFHKEAISNIFSLAKVRKQYRVTYDSDDAYFTVHRSAQGLPDMRFRETSTGLHVYEPDSDGMIFLNTVQENMEAFTKKEIEGAQVARKLLNKLAYPSIKDFEWAVISNQIQDCPVTKRDIEVAQKIWGKDVATLKGKTVKAKAPVVKGVTLQVPKHVLHHNKEVLLTMDIFFVDKCVFLVTLSRKINFTAVHHLQNRKIPVIFQALLKFYSHYLRRGFKVTQINADPEFEALRSHLATIKQGPELNVASTDEHVPEIERRIRVIKERFRALRHSMPYERIPQLMITNMVLYVARVLNHFPTKGGLNSNWSPRMIMSGKPLNYKKDLALEVGSYCQVNQSNTPRNSTKARTTGGICLGPTGNEQGGYKFMSLTTGKKFTGYKWTELPIPDSVIKRVNTLGKDQPKVLAFFDRFGNRIEDDPELTGVDAQAPPEPEPKIESDLELITEPEPLVRQVNEAIQPRLQPKQEQNPQPAPTEVSDQPTVTETVEPVPTPVTIAEEPTPNVTPDPPPAQSTGVGRPVRNRKPYKPAYEPSFTGQRYATALAQIQKDEAIRPEKHLTFFEHMQAVEPKLVAKIMTQMSMKAGLKAWGKKANDATYNEMYQLHWRDTFKPRLWKDLNPDERSQTLESHLFLKLKRCGTVKGRTVAGGNRQRSYINKEDASSPTVSTNAVMLTCVVEAHEGRDIVIVDIPNAFIQTRVKNKKHRVLIKVRGILAEILCDIAPEVYLPYLHEDKYGVKYLILECLNAIYGTMIASLLYYLKFTAS